MGTETAYYCKDGRLDHQKTILENPEMVWKVYEEIWPEIRDNPAPPPNPPIIPVGLL